MHDEFYQGFQRFVAQDAPGLAALQLEFQNTFISPFKVSVTTRELEVCKEAIEAFTRLRNLPTFRRTIQDRLALSHPELTPFRPNTQSVFMGFDFHLGPHGPRLIEINTNAGFGLALNLYYRYRSQVLGESIDPRVFPPDLREQFRSDFLRDWGAGKAPRSARAAVIDHNVNQQALAFEFALFRDLLGETFGSAEIAESGELRAHGAELRAPSGEALSLIYNRATDFYWKDPTSRALRDAWTAGGDFVATPNPFDFALLADKSRMIDFCRRDFLRAHGLDDADVERILAVTLQTHLVTVENAKQLHRDRKKYFFKPFESFGGRAVYNGKGVTTRVWGEILKHSYMAQETASAPEVSCETAPGEKQNYKYDVRLYAFGGELRAVGARLYQGQTTNFRTPLGGFGGVEIRD